MFRIARLAAVAAVVTIFAASAAAQQTRAPSPLAEAVAGTRSAKVDYAFDMAIDSSKQNWRTHYDPHAQPRLQLLQPRREDLTGDERRAFDDAAAHMEGVSWCAGENMSHVDNVRPIREDADTITYSFQPTRESVRGEGARQFADRVRGEMTITKVNPDITHMRIFTPAPFSPVVLVRIDSININIDCAVAPNGRRYGAETVTDMRGSAFGQNFSEHSVQRASNLRTPT